MSEKLADNPEQTSDTVTIAHYPERKRFEAVIGDKTAVLEYMQVGKTFIFSHTEVPIGLEGIGIGGALAKFGLEYVRDNNLKASPLCPFVKAYIEKHPEYKTLVKLGG